MRVAVMVVQIEVTVDEADKRRAVAQSATSHNGTSRFVSIERQNV